MKKRIYIVLIFLTIAIFINMQNCMAFDINPDNWNPENAVKSSEIPDTITDKVENILAFIQAAGVVVSVLALMLIGLRILFGSVEQKKACKEALPGYIIGIFMLFSMSTIPYVIYEFINK